MKIFWVSSAIGFALLTVLIGCTYKGQDRFEGQVVFPLLIDDPSTPYELWLDAIEQPGYVLIDGQATSDIYWGIFGNRDLNLMFVAIEARDSRSTGDYMEIDIEFLNESKYIALENKGENDRPLSTNIDPEMAIPSRPVPTDVKTYNMLSVGGIRRVPPSYVGEIRVTVTLDSWKTILYEEVEWPPISFTP